MSKKLFPDPPISGWKEIAMLPRRGQRTRAVIVNIMRRSKKREWEVRDLNIAIDGISRTKKISVCSSRTEQLNNAIKKGFIERVRTQVYALTEWGRNNNIPKTTEEDSGAVEKVDPQSEIDKLAKYFLDEISDQIEEGSAVDNAIRLLKNYRIAVAATIEILENIYKTMK